MPEGTKGLERVHPSLLFSEKIIRDGFIAKVYCIVAAEVAVAIIIVGIFSSWEPLKQHLLKYQELGTIFLFIGFVGFFAIFYTFACIPRTRKAVPINFILLTLASASMGLMLGTISSVFETSVILLAMLATLGIVIMVTVVSLVCPIDFTKKGNILTIGAGIFSVAFILVMAIGHFLQVKMLYKILIVIGIVLITGFLLHDTQQIIGGRNVEISPEEYIYAAIIIFSDVMNLYMYLLSFLGVDSPK